MAVLKVEAPKGVRRDVVKRSIRDSVSFLEAHSFETHHFFLRIRPARDGSPSWAAILYTLDDAPEAVKRRWKAKPWLQNVEPKN